MAEGGGVVLWRGGTVIFFYIKGDEGAEGTEGAEVGSFSTSIDQYMHMHIRPYQKLIVWREAHELCKWVYRITEVYPSQERYRLVDQLCRASASVPTNIAEGATRRSSKERYHYYEIASTSLEEVYYELLLSKDIGYLSEGDFDIADDKIKRISYLIRKLQDSL